MRWALLLLLSGCVASTPEKPTEYANEPAYAYYVGDSNCAGEHWDWSMAWEIVGIEGDCVSGRMMMDINRLPDADIVFLQLGTNDAKNGITPHARG